MRSARETVFRYLVNTAAAAAVCLAVWMFVESGVSNYYGKQILVVCINVILAASLNLACGFLGQLPLGHAGFMAVGAYVSSIIARYGAAAWPEADPNLLFLLCLTAGALGAGTAGVLVGLPALRLRGDYLAIITLGFGEIIRNIIINTPITGGAMGLNRFRLGGSFDLFSWALGSMLVTLFVIHCLIKSKHGRAIISIRENEIAAAACGVNTTWYKTMAFTLSASFAGVGGALYAQHIGNLMPAGFNFNKSIEILVMVVLGGMGSLAGSVISAAVLTMLPELLRSFADYRMVIYSLLLVTVMVLKPSGLLGAYEFSLVDFVKTLLALPGKFARKRRTQEGPHA